MASFSFEIGGSPMVTYEAEVVTMHKFWLGVLVGIGFESLVLLILVIIYQLRRPPSISRIVRPRGDLIIAIPKDETQERRNQ